MKKKRMLTFILAMSLTAGMGMPATATPVNAAPDIAAQMTQNVVSGLSDPQTDGFAGLAEAAANSEPQDIELTADDTAVEAVILEGMLNGETEITVPSDASKTQAENAVEAALADTNTTDAIEAEVIEENGETTVILNIDPRTEGIIEFMNEGTIMSSGNAGDAITSQMMDAASEEEEETENTEEVAETETAVEENLDPSTSDTDVSDEGVLADEEAGAEDVSVDEEIDADVPADGEVDENTLTDEGAGEVMPAGEGIGEIAPVGEGEADEDPVEVSIDLNSQESSLEEGETFALIATIEGTDEPVTWSSSDTSIATVDNEGVVTAIAEGTTVITAAVGEGDAAKIATCIVTVTKKIDPIPREEETGFTGITVEEKAGILAAYQDMVNFKTEYADLFGVDVPYNTYKDTDQNPLISTLSLTYIYYDPTVYEVEVEGETIEVGGFYRLNMLGGGGGDGYIEVTLADGTRQERSYMDGQSIIFMLKTFDASNQIGAQLFGEGIIADRQGALAEINKAEQAANAQGATLSDAEKYLIINDYISTHARLDLEYMMSSQGLKARDEATDPYYDTIHGILSQNPDYVSLPDAQKAYMIEGVENMWKTNQIGSLGMGQGLCVSYVNAFSYLVQCANPEIYMNGDGSWKSYTEVNYIQNADGTYEQSVDAPYIVDMVDSVLNAFASTFGEGQYATSDHYWNTVLADGQWYNIDTNYCDAFISSMQQVRGEVDGSLNHLPFMFCEADWINLFGEEHFVSIDSMYSDLTTDDELEHTWFSYANGPVSIGSDGFYYAYDSTDTFELLNSASSFNIDQEAMTPKYKICKRSYGLADESDAMTPLIEFAVSDSSDSTAGTTVYDPSTGSMEKHDELTALYEKMVQEMEIYPAIAITGSLYEGKFYFNLSNCIMSYDIQTGAVERVKEYNSASATRDWTKALGCDAFTITSNTSSATISVENHPLTSLAIIDGQMHTAVATNYALISTPGWRHFLDIAGATGIAGYGYEFEETNYNADYADYDEYLNGEYGDILKNFLTQEENDNAEFMYTASIHDHTTSMDQLTGSHNYATVSIPATCGQNAFTEDRCTDCGAIKAGSRVEEEGTAHEHHYVKFEETYYRTTDDSDPKKPAMGDSYDPSKNVQYETGTSYVCVECLKSSDEEIAGAGHTYKADDVEWAADNKSVTVTSLVCSYICSEIEDDLDVLVADTTIHVPASSPVTLEATSSQTGNSIVYTAEGEVDGHSVTVTKTVEKQEGECWHQEMEKIEAVAATCTEAGNNEYYYCSECNKYFKDEAGNEETTVNAEIIPALGHAEGEPVQENVSGATCTVAGSYDEVVYCTRCNEELSRTKVTGEALGHDYEDVVTEPTCKERGYTTHTCKNCGDSYQDTYVDALPHTEVVDEAVEATCTVAGKTQGSHCEVCGTVLTAQTEIPATGHHYLGIITRATCTSIGYITYTCEVCGDQYTKHYEDALGHTPVTDPAVEADCTHSGLTEGSHCEVCGEILNPQEVVPANGHTYDEGEVTKKAGYTEEGEIVYTCTVCGETKTEILPQTGVAAPVLTDAYNSATGVTVKWNKVSGAVKYRVFYKLPGRSWTRGGDTASTSAIVTGLTSNNDYTFTVRCIDEKGNYVSTYDSKGLTVHYVAAPVLNSVSNAASGVTVNWQASAGAAQYRIFYKTAGGSWTRGGVSTGTSYTVTGLTSGTQYTFTVRAMDRSNNYISAFDTAGKTITYVAAPVLSDVENTNSGVRVRWAASNGAARYRVYYKVSGGSWTRAGETTGTSYTVTGLQSGTTYTFTVRCLNSNGQFCSSFDSRGKSLKYLATPSVRAAQASKGVRVTWSRVTGASGYYVYRKTAGGSWSRIRTIQSGSTVSYTDTTGRTGTTYYYTVRAYSGSVRSSFKSAGASAKAG